MDPRTDRGQLTRNHIVGAATRLFAEGGYDATSIEMILRACDISRGALYHHFAGKQAVFTAVVEEIEAQILGRLMQAGQAAQDAVSGLHAGCMAWLDMASDPVIRQVILMDAPAVLGWAGWRAIEARYSLGVLRAGLGLAAAEGRLDAGMVEMQAHVMLAMLTEVAMMIARADDTAAVTAAGQHAVRQFLTGLLGAASG